MKKLYFSLVALLLVAAGCSKDELTTDNGVVAPVAQARTITSVVATMEGDADTRTQLVDGKQVVWQEDEMISVAPLGESATVNPYGNAFVHYQLAEGAGTTKGKFVGDALIGDSFIAFTDYNVANWDGTDDLSIYWDYPSKVVFDIVEGNFNHNIPMFAKENNGVFEFKQLGGILHFQVTGTERLAYVRLTSNDGMKFPQSVKVEFSGEEPAIVQDDSGYMFASDQIFVKPQHEVYLSDEPVNVYFVLPAGMTFENGLTLSIYMKDENYNQTIARKTTQEKIVVNRKMVKTFSAFDAAALAAEQKEKTKNAMIALYNALGGTENPWIVDRQWDPNKPIESWGNVSIYDGEVFGINLDNDGWEGDFAIPAEIADLPLEDLQLRNFKSVSGIDNIANISTLRSLLIRSCNLEGPLPASWAGLLKLESLDLSENNLTGSIPDAWFNGFPNIRRIALYWNRLSGLVTTQQQQSPMWQRLVAYDSPEFWRGYLENQQDGYGLGIQGVIYFVINKHQYKIALGETAQIDLRFIGDAEWDDLGYDYDHNVIEIDIETGTIQAKATGSTFVNIVTVDDPNTVVETFLVNVQEISVESTGNENFTDEEGEW